MHSALPQPRTPVRSSSQSAILLTSTIRLPVGKDPRGPIPQTPPYAPLNQIGRTGFSFKFINLLHAIGCKTASLPSSQRAECISSAYLFNHLLRLDPAGNLYTRDLPDSDLQTPRSQELGIGMLCLFARHYWKIPWDALEPIPGQGKRFDYRGQTKGLRAIFEAKGTRHRKNQPQQIQHGLDKKKAHHKRGERYDIELIVGTHIGGHRDRSCLLLADPEFPEDEFSFGPDAKYFFRLRHYARVLHYAGAPNLGYELRQEADLLYQSARGLPRFPTDLLQGRFLSRGRTGRRQEELQNLSEQTAGGASFLGTWYDSWRPFGENPDQSPRIANFLAQEPLPGLQVFQGLRSDLVHNIESRGPPFLLDISDGDAPELIEEDESSISSIFSDGSILSIRN